MALGSSRGFSGQGALWKLSLGGQNQGWLQGHVTWAVARGPMLGSALCHHLPERLTLLQCGALRFHFAFICIPVAYVAGPTSSWLHSGIPRRRQLSRYRWPTCLGGQGQEGKSCSVFLPCSRPGSVLGAGDHRGQDSSRRRGC